MLHCSRTRRRAFGSNANSLRFRASSFRRGVKMKRGMLCIPTLRFADEYLAFGEYFPPSRRLASGRRAFGGNANSLRFRASSFRRGVKMKRGMLCIPTLRFADEYLAFGEYFPPSRRLASGRRAFGGNANSLRFRAEPIRRIGKTKTG